VVNAPAALTPVPTVQEVVWVPGPFRTCVKSITLTGIRSPDLSTSKEPIIGQKAGKIWYWNLTSREHSVSVIETRNVLELFQTKFSECPWTFPNKIFRMSLSFSKQNFQNVLELFQTKFSECPRAFPNKIFRMSSSFSKQNFQNVLELFQTTFSECPWAFPNNLFRMSLSFSKQHFHNVLELFQTKFSELPWDFPNKIFRMSLSFSKQNFQNVLELFQTNFLECPWAFPNKISYNPRNCTAEIALAYGVSSRAVSVSDFVNY
jgi:hypothetical protein